MWYIHRVEHHSATKRSKIMSSAAMDLEIIILSELNQREKDKHHM